MYVGGKDAKKNAEDLRAAGEMLLRLADREAEARKQQREKIDAIVGRVRALPTLPDAVPSDCC